MERHVSARAPEFEFLLRDPPLVYDDAERGRRVLNETARRFLDEALVPELRAAYRFLGRRLGSAHLPSAQAPLTVVVRDLSSSWWGKVQAWLGGSDRRPTGGADPLRPSRLEFDFSILAMDPGQRSALLLHEAAHGLMFAMNRGAAANLLSDPAAHATFFESLAVFYEDEACPEADRHLSTFDFGNPGMPDRFAGGLLREDEGWLAYQAMPLWKHLERRFPGLVDALVKDDYPAWGLVSAGGLLASLEARIREASAGRVDFARAYADLGVAFQVARGADPSSPCAIPDLPLWARTWPPRPAEPMSRLVRGGPLPPLSVRASAVDIPVARGGAVTLRVEPHGLGPGLQAFLYKRAAREDPASWEARAVTEAFSWPVRAGEQVAAALVNATARRVPAPSLRLSAS